MTLADVLHVLRWMALWLGVSFLLACVVWLVGHLLAYIAEDKL